MHSLLLRGISLAIINAHTRDAILLGHIRLSKHTKWIDTLSILLGGRKGNRNQTGTLTPV
jgi:hypothetical protein